MTNSADFIKNKIEKSLKLPKNYKIRHKIGPGSEKFDQELWEDGGLTFSNDGLIYSSNDRAIFQE